MYSLDPSRRLLPRPQQILLTLFGIFRSTNNIINQIFHDLNGPIMASKHENIIIKQEEFAIVFLIGKVTELTKASFNRVF